MYFIDGYNFIFSLIHTKMNLQTMRQKVIRYLQKRFTAKKLSGLIVFDGAHKKGEESGLSYPSPLTVAYTPKGQSADEYIVEQIEVAKKPKTITVVTDDKGLRMHAKSLGAHIQTNKAFFLWLRKKKVQRVKPEPKETEENLKRLEKIFEERLRKGEEDKF